jgi:MoaA/NifB/PqqE/SkfB family radical SAM enzyme
LGNTCSYTCSYCPSYLNDGSSPWRDVEILKKFIDNIFALVKDKQIVVEFTGGEVTLYKDYGKLCAYIKSKGGIVSMISNGSRTMDWWRKNSENFDQVLLSYHTEFARKDHYLELVDYLKDKVDLCCNIMTPPGKIDSCIDIGTEVKNKRDTIVNLAPLIEDLEGELLPAYTEVELRKIDDFNASSSELHNYSGRKRLTFRKNLVKVFPNGESKPTAHSNLVSNKENSWFGWNCYSGVTQISVSVDEIYRGWCFVGGKIGNVANPNLSLPDTPIVCNKELCHCNFDLYSKKERVI